MEENESLRLTHFERDFLQSPKSNCYSLASTCHCGVSGLASDLDWALDFFFFFYETIIEPLKMWLNSRLLSYRAVYQRLKVQKSFDQQNIKSSLW